MEWPPHGRSPCSESAERRCSGSSVVFQRPKDVHAHAPLLPTLHVRSGEHVKGPSFHQRIIVSSLSTSDEHLGNPRCGRGFRPWRSPHRQLKGGTILPLCVRMPRIIFNGAWSLKRRTQPHQAGLGEELAWFFQRGWGRWHVFWNCIKTWIQILSNIGSWARNTTEMP